MTKPETAFPTRVEVRIDAAQTLGTLHRSEKYINTSLRFAPPPALLQKASANFGRFRMARVFLTLDEYWDYRDDSFHPNYRIGRDRYQGDTIIHPYDRARSRESEVNYLDYLDGVATQSDSLLLCVRRYEHEVTGGVITRQKYESVLLSAIRMIKERHPNLQYVEALNEPNNDHFGGLDDSAYYEFYRSFYRVVNALNAEKLPGSEIGLGGPAADKNNFQAVRSLLIAFQADRDPGKRLDFVTFHDYASGERPVRVHDLREQLDKSLVEAGLPANLPAFITEMGTHEGQKGGNTCMAAGVPALFEQVRRQHDLVAFPWCVYHDPEIQLWSTQHLPNGKMTPHGMAMALLAMHRDKELTVESNGVDTDGLGVYALASRDEGGMCLHVWNYSKVPAKVYIAIYQIPPFTRTTVYRLDSRNNNVLEDPEHPGTLQKAQVSEALPDSEYSVELESYAHVLWLFE